MSTLRGSALTHCPMHYVYIYMKQAFGSAQGARIKPFIVHLLTHCSGAGDKPKGLIKASLNVGVLH